MGSARDAGAVELLTLAAFLISDVVVWTRKARAARGFVHHHEKVRRNGTVRAECWTSETLSPLDRRASQWSVMGALELVADEPNEPDVVRALDLLRIAGRGWSISRVEEQLGHTWTLWTLSVAVARRPGLRLSPRGRQSEVDLTLETRREAAAEEGPATLRSSELRPRRRRAA